jgi:hypothetical protein
MPRFRSIKGLETLINQQCCPANLTALDINVIFNDIPGSNEHIVRLDAPDCQNDAVVALNDTITVWHGIENIVEIVYNDYDTKGNLDSLSIDIITPVANGEIDFDPHTGEITYIPNQCFFGTDSFRYTISNIEGITSNEAVVYLKVNINPHLDSDNDSIPDINEDIVGTGNLCDTDTDMDGKPNFLDDDDDNDDIATITSPAILIIMEYLITSKTGILLLLTTALLQVLKYLCGFL